MTLKIIRNLNCKTNRVRKNEAIYATESPYAFAPSLASQDSIAHISCAITPVGVQHLRHHRNVSMRWVPLPRTTLGHLWLKRRVYPLAPTAASQGGRPNFQTTQNTRLPNLTTLTRPHSIFSLDFCFCVCVHDNNKSNNLNSTVLQAVLRINSNAEALHILHPKPRSACRYLAHATYEHSTVGSSHFTRFISTAFYTFPSHVLLKTQIVISRLKEQM